MIPTPRPPCAGSLPARLLLAITLACCAASALHAQLIVEKPQGGPNQYNSLLGTVSAAFYVDEPTRIQGIYGWMNGSGFATVGITNEARSLFLGSSFLLDTVTDAPAKWQGAGSLTFDLAPGEYRVELAGAEYPFAYGGPPSTAPQEPTDFRVIVDGQWEESAYPFGVRLYGVPLSAVPEPAAYGWIGVASLVVLTASRRLRRSSHLAATPNAAS